MESLTINNGSLTVTVDANFIRVRYYDGVEHRLKINRQVLRYVDENNELREYRGTIHKAVFYWNEFFGKGPQQIAI